MIVLSVGENNHLHIKTWNTLNFHVYFIETLLCQLTERFGYGCVWTVIFTMFIFPCIALKKKSRTF